METEPGGSPTIPWYAKFFEYWRNRNRVGPGRVELADCDFFIVGPRRTLRILRPPLKGAWYYEITNDQRPESINDNFFTRWSRRPHSSGNCRCSFRQSSRLSTTEERIISAELNRIRTSLCEAEKTGQDIEELERRLSVDLQKLQDSVPEIHARNDENEDRIQRKDLDPTFDDNRIDEQTIKSKIVKDLEKYINDLLEEILDDTVKVIAGAEDTIGKEVKKQKFRKKGDLSRRILETDCGTAGSSGSEGSLDISFSFHADNEKKELGKKDEISANVGYVNPGFIGSTNDPDSLDFYLRRTMDTEMGLENLDCIDSGINSVETVEFQPDQEPSLEQSLLRIIDEKLGRTPLENSWEDIRVNDKEEESRKVLQIERTSKLEMVNEKLNTTDLEKTENWKDSGEIEKNEKIESVQDQQLEPKEHESESHKKEPVHRNEQRETERSTEKSEGSEVSAKNNAESGESERWRIEDAGTLDISYDNLDVRPANVLEDVPNEPSFEKSRLEFKDINKESSSKNKRSGRTMTKLREKLRTNLDESSKALKKTWNDRVVALEARKETSSIELQDCKRKWPNDFEEAEAGNDREPNSLSNSIVFRKIRKPTIVFLHGFGSSAEIFEHQLEYFSALGYPCIAPDMLGHGMSSAPGRARDYHFGKLLKDLDAVLHHYAFRPGQKCVLVAHNYGCSFATALACKYDANIHQLVLISGGGPTPLAPPSTESAGHWCLRAVLAPFLMCGLHRGILYSARGRQHPYCGPEPPEQWPSHMKYVLDGMLWPEGDYVYHRRICTPTLLVHGLRDNKVSLVQECQMERTMMKAFLEAIPVAGHTPMTDCPEQLNHMIHCFIDLWKNKKWQQ